MTSSKQPKKPQRINKGVRVYNAYRKIAVLLRMIEPRASKGDKVHIDRLKAYALKEDLSVDQMYERAKSGDLSKFKGRIKDTKDRVDEFTDRAVSSGETPFMKKQRNVEIATDSIFNTFKIQSKTDRAKVIQEVVKQSVSGQLDAHTSAVVLAAIKEANKMYKDEHVEDIKSAVTFQLMDSRAAAQKHLEYERNETEIIEIQEEDTFTADFNEDSAIVLN